MEKVDKNCIGISEDRLHHIIGVARKAYSIAKDMGYDDYFAKKMFAIGWNHDIGYEFSKEAKEHPSLGAAILYSTFGVNEKPAFNAINEHGYVTENDTLEYKILSMADLLIDGKGKEVTVLQRLEDIRTRYGVEAPEYQNAYRVARHVGLLSEVNTSNALTL